MDRYWYMRVTLYKKRKLHQKKINQLMAQAFIPNPENKPIAHHINHVTNDNRIENLMWFTIQENTKEWWDFGRIVTEKHRESARRIGKLNRKLPIK